MDKKPLFKLIPGIGPPTGMPVLNSANIPAPVHLSAAEMEILARHVDYPILVEESLQPDPENGKPHKDSFFLEETLYHLTKEAVHNGADAIQAREAIEVLARYYKLAARILAEINRRRPSGT